MSEHPVEHDEHATREVVTMGLYLCLVLGAEFVAVDDHVHAASRALEIIWGTTLGLALAHAFSFGLVSRLFTGGQLSAAARVTMFWQLLAAIALATALSIPFAFLGVPKAFDVDAVLIALGFGFVVFSVARVLGMATLPAVTNGLVMVILAGVVVVAKVALSAH